MELPNRQSDAWKIEQQPQRQDSLREQLITVHDAATRLGCYDAADWLWKNMLSSTNAR